MSQGLPVEADAIVGDFVTEGEKQGVRTPLLSAAYTQLCLYAAGRAGQGSAGNRTVADTPAGPSVRMTPDPAAQG
jgi:hypothetical protein